MCSYTVIHLLYLSVLFFLCKKLSLLFISKIVFLFFRYQQVKAYTTITRSKMSKEPCKRLNIFNNTTSNGLTFMDRIAKSYDPLLHLSINKTMVKQLYETKNLTNLTYHIQYIYKRLSITGSKSLQKYFILGLLIHILFKHYPVVKISRLLDISSSYAYQLMRLFRLINGTKIANCRVSGGFVMSKLSLIKRYFAQEINVRRWVDVNTNFSK